MHCTLGNQKFLWSGDSRGTIARASPLPNHWMPIYGVDFESRMDYLNSFCLPYLLGWYCPGVQGVFPCHPPPLSTLQDRSQCWPWGWTYQGTFGTYWSGRWPSKFRCPGMILIDFWPQAGLAVLIMTIIAKLLNKLIIYYYNIKKFYPKFNKKFKISRVAKVNTKFKLSRVRKKDHLPCSHISLLSCFFYFNWRSLRTFSYITQIASFQPSF